MESCRPEDADALRADLILVLEEINNRVVPSRTKAEESCFQKWEIFFRARNMDTFIDKVRDLVPYLHIFTRRVRSGLFTHNGEPVRSRTAGAYLRVVGQTFANVDIEDPRLNKHRSIDHRLQRQLRGWKNWMVPRRGSNPSILGSYITPLRRCTSKTTTKSIASSVLYTWPCFSLTGQVIAP